MSFSETQEQILDAAMDVIVRDGLDSTSMRAVAEEAEVSLGLLSYHFEGKEKLIVAAFQRATERLIQLIDDRMAEAGDDPRDRVKAARTRAMAVAPSQATLRHTSTRATSRLV